MPAPSMFMLCRNKTNLTFDQVKLHMETGDWFMEPKLDGMRVMIIIGNGPVRIMSKTWHDVTMKFPEIVAKAEKIKGLGEFWMDGEIIPESKKFTDISRRISSSNNLPGHFNFVPFDYPVKFGIDCRAYHYHSRTVSPPEIWHQFDPINFTDRQGWEQVLAKHKVNGGEGVVLKNLRSRYVPGHSPNWRKHKFVDSVTAVLGTRKGNSVRWTLLGILGGALPVCGTVCVNDQAALAEIDHYLGLGSNNPKNCIEIEFSGILENGGLRFPVFKGLRHRVDVTSVSITQLDSVRRV